MVVAGLKMVMQQIVLVIVVHLMEENVHEMVELVEKEIILVILAVMVDLVVVVAVVTTQELAEVAEAILVEMEETIFAVRTLGVLVEVVDHIILMVVLLQVNALAMVKQ